MEENPEVNDDSVDYFLAVSKKYDETQADRKQLKDKLMGIVNEMNIDFKDKAMTNQVKVSLISTTMALLNDMDGQVTTFEKLKLSKKDSDGEKKYSELIVGFLNKLQHEIPKGSAVKNNIPTDEDIDKIYKEKCEEVLPGELE